MGLALFRFDWVNLVATPGLGPNGPRFDALTDQRI
jgi:hypothetical protein